jgi:hypothetical protein
MTVQELFESYPSKPQTGLVIPCNNNTHYVRLNNLQVSEYFAIYLLYEYTQKRCFLPSTVLHYCKFPARANEEYERACLPFLRRMSSNKDYFFQGKLYQHYASEMKELLSDLQEGGNYQVNRELCFLLWVHYRVLFREEFFSTQAVVEANPVLCKTHAIAYAGPLLF